MAETTDMSDNELNARVAALLAACDPAEADQATFRGVQYDHGLAWVHFPEGKGGLGIGRRGQGVVDAALQAAGVTYNSMSVNPIGIGMGAPVVLTHGTDEMHERFLRRIFTGEDIWCQMFSEPGAGSDVAGLSSRAVRDGDEWIVDGQKVWTSLAHVSSFGMLVARTDPDQPKHKGLSYFVLDMHAPGVDVRPLYQATGDAEFNEVFFDQVRIPHDMMLGDEGEGWKVAVTTLMNERVALGGGIAARGSGSIAHLLEVWEDRRDSLEPAARAAASKRVTRLWIEAEVLRLTNIRAAQTSRGGIPGPEGSVGKLMSAELNQRVYEAALDLLGPEGMIHEPGYPLVRSADGFRSTSTSKMFIRSRANTIEGGTSEVMRNILGERVLGLPGEPRVDKNEPWSAIPRNA